MVVALNIPRYTLLGCDSSQSRATLARLLKMGLPPAAVLFDHPSTYRPLPLGTTRELTLATLAASVGIPCQGLPPQLLSGCLAGQPTAPLLVSCYPHRIDDDSLQLLTLGAFNIHPSRLPAYRGPAPLFWQLRAGETNIGVSLHRITPSLDSGPLLGRSELAIEAGDTLSTLSRKAGNAGAQLFAQHLPSILRGSPIVRPQSVQQASHQVWPDENARTLGDNWSPLRVYNFVNGIQPDYTPLLQEQSQRQAVQRALAWSDSKSPPDPGADQRIYRGARGWVLLQLEPSA